MDQAVNFFHEMFCFTAVTQIGLWQINKSLKESYRIQDNTEKATMKMLRAGDAITQRLVKASK